MTKKILLAVLAGLGVLFLTLGIFRGSSFDIGFDEFPMHKGGMMMSPKFEKEEDFYININGKEMDKKTFNELTDEGKKEVKEYIGKAKKAGEDIIYKTESMLEGSKDMFDDSFGMMNRKPMYLGNKHMMDNEFSIGFNISTIALIAIAGTVGYIIGRDRK